MKQSTPTGLRSGLQTSPWIILGSTVILLIAVIVFAVQNSHREKQYMSQLMSTKGAALILAVEAGTRAGMMGMMWGGQQIQQLLEETGRLPDVLYMAVVDENGIVVAHSDPSKINTPFRQNRKLIHLGPDLKENWELVDLGASRRSFEVHRHFRPLFTDGGVEYNHMQGMMRRHMMGPVTADDWFAPQNRQQLLIVVGLDVDPFEAATREDIRTTVVMSAIILLTGFGGFVSLFWMHSYRAAKRSLQDTSAFADELVTNLPVGLIATDQAGHITFFNAKAETITGLRAVLAKGQIADNLLPANLCGVEQSFNRGKTITEQETECTFSDGRSVPLSISAARIINEIGEFIGQVLILRDLREVRRLQADVRRQEKLAALGKLAAGVAHEIRNPLSSIKGLASFFADQFNDGSEAKAAAGVMIHEVNRLNRSISELLDFARPTDLKLQSIDLAPLLGRSIQLIQQDAANQNVQIDLSVADDICPVRIDPDRFNQCLLNLYLNGIQAMTDGGILRVACASENDRHVRITISDTGQGIVADHLGKIFDPYFTTKNKGTGLGLAVVHKIIEAHGANLNVASIPDKGTTITIQLPCSPST
ncbi:ATP-binding protein [uncultured Desulfosarcina sp.]|uniref:ATP-binding protein n=1 Tax=uncultured Desulfosarcina sp. TaxID=218289 RepID=UPI0029C7DDC1|nr:ATP-binding protein [uncultured Desulfosarcina sp.]